MKLIQQYETHNNKSFNISLYYEAKKYWVCIYPITMKDNQEYSVQMFSPSDMIQKQVYSVRTRRTVSTDNQAKQEFQDWKEIIFQKAFNIDLTTTQPC